MPTLQEPILGTYSPYTCEIPQEAKRAFEEATDGLLGIVYSPVAISQQQVAGTNYRFFCNTKSATRYPAYGAAIVSVYQPLSGKAHLKSIQAID